MALGAILREERERRGLTEHQVADATRMMVQMVRELEDEDLHRIAAPIYGRGFIKLYAGFLGIDPVPLIKDFEELYAQRGQRPAPPPRVSLERFGGGSGTGLERVEPTEVPPQAPEVPPEGIRIPAPKAVRSMPAQASAPVAAPVSVPVPKPLARPAVQPAPPPSDLFGEKLDDPVPEAIPPEPDGKIFAVPRPASPGTVPSASAVSAGTGARRSVLDSASHRFEGHPYRPGMGRVVGGWLARGVGLLAGALAFVGVGIWSGLRLAGGKCRLAGAAFLSLPWVRIGRVAAVVVPSVAVLAGLVLGVRSCMDRRSEVAREAATLDTTVVLERILPPPAGYAD